jgi:hypothetical protein
MKSNKVGTTLKHPETINGNVKNLSKSDIILYLSFSSFYFKNLSKSDIILYLSFSSFYLSFSSFYFKNLILPLISILLASLTTFSALARLLLLCSPNPTLCLQNDALKLKKKRLKSVFFSDLSVPKRYFRS